LSGLIAPDPNDPIFKAQPGAFRAELHDRIIASLYPVVFVFVAYAFLGIPSTTRQSRGLALASTIGTVAFLRFIGFGSVIAAAQSPWAVSVLYTSAAVAIALSALAISRGLSVEPPAFVSRGIAMLSTLIARRVPAR
jgi:lipopolysaccharide export system permease protein